MKKINLLMMLAIIAIINLTSCSNDDESTSTNQNNEQNTTEENKVPIATLESGIKIEGASKNIGNPPAPNSNLDFQLNTDLQEAFQRTGFRIEFSSNDAISGAYIKFKDVDSNPSDSYFDVSNSLFSKVENSKKTGNSKKQQSNFKITQDYENTIEVDFKQNIPAGQFCYDICLYDASYNISQIQTVCITVEAWGGNTEIVGEWIFDKWIIFDIFDIEKPDSDGDTSVRCTNGQYIIINHNEYIKEEWILAFNEDGSFFEVNDDEYYPLDFTATQSACSPVYGNELEKENIKYSGNWAYNEEDQTLSAIDFKEEDFLSPSNSSTYTDGELNFGGVNAVVISNQLVVTETEDGETYKYYFNRK